MTNGKLALGWNKSYHNPLAHVCLDCPFRVGPYLLFYVLKQENILYNIKRGKTCLLMVIPRSSLKLLNKQNHSSLLSSLAFSPLVSGVLLSASLLIVCVYPQEELGLLYWEVSNKNFLNCYVSSFRRILIVHNFPLRQYVYCLFSPDLFLENKLTYDSGDLIEYRISHFER